MNGIIDSVLSMRLDVYRQIDQQDPDTGAIKKEWIYQRSMDCHAKGTISNSATTRSSDKQIFDNRYANDQQVQVRTTERLTSRDKVSNIRDQKNNPREPATWITVQR